MKVKVAAVSSAITTEAQIPSTGGFQTSGNNNTAAIWNTNVLKNDIIAEIRPLFKAVKNPEPNIAIPQNKNWNENILNPLIVKSSVSGLLLINIKDNGSASNSPNNNIDIDKIAIIIKCINK